MTRTRYRKNESPGSEWPTDPDWPVYDVQVQDQPRGQWRHVGRVARFGHGDWAALGADAAAWTTYHPTRQAAVADMLAGRTFLDRMREEPGAGTGHVAGRPGTSDSVYERDGEVYRGHRYSPRGTQALASADYIVRRDSDGRYGGFIADSAGDDGRSPGDEYRFEVYDDSGRYLARTRSFRGALMVLAMPRRTRWIAEHLQPGRGGATGADPPAAPSGELAGDSAYRAALAALDSFGHAARTHQQAAEALEAQLTVHGFDRHPELMAHITALRALARQIRADIGRARQVLADHHAAGEEYHTNHADADASGFRST